jgi:hypothetical protein
MRLTITPPSILVFFLFVFSFALQAQRWDFVKEKSGIRIFLKKEPGNSLKSFKGVMEVRSTMEKIQTIVGNVRNFDMWDESIRELKIIDEKENVFTQYYLVYHVPWPLNDRDLCVEARISVDSATGKKVIYATPLSDVIPEYPERVRIRNYWQQWTIEPLKNGFIRLTLEGFADPGGIIPSWLYNMVITDTPLNLMLKVKEKVEIPPE